MMARSSKAVHPSLLARLLVEPKTGSEPFAGVPTDATLLDFWRWYASDLLANGCRARIAEFVVAMAVGDRRPVCDAWGSCDVISKDGVRVEVKATCAVQTWKQDAPSKPVFAIRPSRSWTQEQGMSPGAQRNSEVFVFCQLLVVGERVPDPLDVRQWRFFVLPTAVLNERAPKAKTVTLGRVVQWGAVEVGFEELAGAVTAAAVRPEDGKHA